MRSVAIVLGGALIGVGIGAAIDALRTSAVVVADTRSVVTDTGSVVTDTTALCPAEHFPVKIPSRLGYGCARGFVP